MHRTSWLVCALVAFGILAIVSARHGGAAQGVSSARQIQATLDANGFCQLGAGTYTLDAPIRLRAGQRLLGVGPATKLDYRGTTPWAVVFGEREKPNYACHLERLSIRGGGVLCENIAQHCTIEGVWVSEAPLDGVRIEGEGERIVLRDVVSWQNGGAGFAVRTDSANNGVLFDHCNAQGNRGSGMLFETTDRDGELTACVVRDCTIQSNGTGGAAAEVLLRGYVNVLRIENTWIERAARGGAAGVGLRTEAVEFPARDGKDPVTRFPGRLTITGTTVIALLPRAVELAPCFDCAIEQLWATPASSKVLWRSEGTGASKPRGAMFVLDPAQLVADPALR